MGIHIKNEAEIQAMREGGVILSKILKELSEFLKPGHSTMDLERKAEELFEHYNVIPAFKGYHGFPAILCTAVNDEIVHGIPNETPMKKGDIINVDCGVTYKKLHTDSCVALVVGGETDPQSQKLVDTCIEALWKGIAQVKPGNRVGDIGHAIETHVKRNGFTVVKELTGHGIGYNLHEDPYVPNWGKKGKGAALVPGMVIAIEPIIVAGSSQNKTLDDDWTIVTKDGSRAIQHEHTVLVTETGYEVLTLREGEKQL